MISVTTVLLKLRLLELQLREIPCNCQVIKIRLHTHYRQGVTESTLTALVATGNRNEHLACVKLSSLPKQILLWTEILSSRFFSIPLTNSMHIL